MKKIKIFHYLFIILIVTVIGCQERGMPAKIPYVFWIKDMNGNNLVGDSINPNRYNIDSIRYFNIMGNIIDSTKNEFRINKNISGYYFDGATTINSNITYKLLYNKNEADTIRIAYGKDNINVYQNNQLIFSKYNLSQVPPVEFNIIR